MIDGPVLLSEALDAGVDIDTVYVESRPDLDGLIARAYDAGARVRTVDDGVLDKVLDLGSAQGVVATAALVDSSETAVEAILRSAAASGRPVVGLVELADPGNVGTIIRQAEAFGAAGVICLGGGVDVHNPKTVRAAAGALFRVAVGTAEDVYAVIGVAADLGLVTAATAGEGIGGRELTPTNAPLSGGSLILIGNEAHGLAGDVIDATAVVLSIDMEGRVESLNAATAAAVVLYEASRQRAEATAENTGSGPAGAVGHDGHRSDAVVADGVPEAGDGSTSR